MNLTAQQARGLDRLGDMVIPGAGALPSFSASGAGGHITLMLPYMHDSDRRDFLALLDACAKLPKPAIKALVALAAGWQQAPEPVAGLLRMANIGIKGVVHSLYYADVDSVGVRTAIGYDAHLNEAAYEAARAAQESA